MEEREVAVVIHYWGKIGVAGIEVTNGELKVGDKIHIKGATSDFTQTVESMQVESKLVEKAVKGDRVGLKVTGPSHEHDKIYVVIGS
ncbi:MAG: EF-Tu/IF-2/RF-3 family GTPase [Candidatus Omnitrophica bacterium]|nr:EF-Tu/IF-2/RF-3 family GTPase [Candidatus Omnitrophota bacterium]